MSNLIPRDGSRALARIPPAPVVGFARERARAFGVLHLGRRSRRRVERVRFARDAARPPRRRYPRRLHLSQSGRRRFASRNGNTRADVSHPGRHRICVSRARRRERPGGRRRVRDDFRSDGKTRRDGVARDGRGAQPLARGRARARVVSPRDAPRHVAFPGRSRMRPNRRVARGRIGRRSGRRRARASLATTRGDEPGESHGVRRVAAPPRGRRRSPRAPRAPRTDRSRRRVDGTRRGRARRDGRASSARRGGGRRRNRRASSRRDVRSTRVRRRGFGRRRRGGGDGRIHRRARSGGRVAGATMARRGSRRAALGSRTRGPAGETRATRVSRAKKMVRTTRRRGKTRRRALRSPTSAPNLRDARESEGLWRAKQARERLGHTRGAFGLGQIIRGSSFGRGV